MSNQPYCAIYPTFWTGETGKKIRAAGMEAQIVAMYLMTNNYKNALGIYYIPKVLIAYETACSEEGASKGLQRCSEGGFCAYDDVSEVVWIYEMAHHQLGDTLKPGDNRVKWINNAYASLPKNPFLLPFYEKYGERYHIEKPRGSEGPSKPLQSPSEASTSTITITNTNTKTKSSELCESSKPPPDVVLEIPLAHKRKSGDPEMHPVCQTEIDDWSESYPGVDVLQELKSLRQWNISNKRKRKSRTGIRKHITSWLSKTQNDTSNRRAPPHKATGRLTLEERNRIAAEEFLNDDG